MCSAHDNNLALQRTLRELLNRFNIPGEVEVVELPDVSIAELPYNANWTMKAQQRAELLATMRQTSSLATVRDAVPFHLGIKRMKSTLTEPIAIIDEKSETISAGSGGGGAGGDTHTGPINHIRRPNLATPNASEKAKINLRISRQFSELNAVIRQRSSAASLIVLNLPDPRPREAENYLTYMDLLTANLNRVLFVNGTGQEIVTDIR